jgi:aconitate hydratase
MLALTFINEADYDKIRENDQIDFVDLTTFAPEKPLTLNLKHDDGTSETIQVGHTYNAQQIEWFKAGGALNLIRKNLN